MIVVKNKILPIGKRFSAINIFGIVFVKSTVRVTPRLLNHERIHSHQMIELCYLGFYLIYIIEWFIRLIHTKGKNYAAYRSISFEREAYYNDSNFNYLTNRRHFSQWRGHGKS